MTVSTTTSIKIYAGNNSTTLFPVPFQFFDDTDLVVTHTVAGVDTIRILTTDYTVTGGDGGLGDVTTIFTPDNGETLTIQRVLPRTQTTDYVENDKFPAETHEQALDKLTLLDQERDEAISRAPKFPPSADIKDVLLPLLAGNAGKAWVINDAEDGIDVSDSDLGDLVGDAATLAAANAAAVSAAASAAAASQSADDAQSAVVGGVVLTTLTADPTITNSDTGKAYILDRSGGIFSIALPSIAGLDSDFHLYFKAAGDKGLSVSIAPDGSDTINGTSSIFLEYNAWVHLGIDGTEWKFISSSFIDAPGDGGEILFNTSDQLSADANLSFDTATSILAVGGTGAISNPQGTIAQRPGTPVNGMIRYNTDTDVLEARINGAWVAISTGTTGGLSLVTVLATTSGSDVEWTSIPAGITQARVVFYRVDGSSELNIEMGNSGGYVTSGYQSSLEQTVRSGGGATPPDIKDSTSDIAISSSGVSTEVQATIDFTLLDSDRWVISGNGLDQRRVAATNVSSSVDLGGTLDRIKVESGSGSFTAGAVALYTN